MNASGVREHMQVFASDGEQVGIVAAVEGRSIKLTKSSPEAGGEHRYVPLAWVEKVDQAVYLSRPPEDVRYLWQPTPAGAGGD